jgi:hypothetical protein
MELLVKAYFQQSVMYYSASNHRMRQIQSLHPAHAANAARKLAENAAFWADEAGVTPKDAEVWMWNQPVFQALVERGASDLS